jgi:hypothetical protein
MNPLHLHLSDNQSTVFTSKSLPNLGTPKNWTQVIDMTKNVEPSTKVGDEHHLDPVQARYVRVNMLNHSSNPGVHFNEPMGYEAAKKSVSTSQDLPVGMTP